MPTVAHVVKKLVDERPVLSELLAEGIISHAALAENLKKRVESELGKKVKSAAIVMAIRRHAESIKGVTRKRPILFRGAEISMTTGFSVLAFRTHRTLLQNTEKIHKIAESGKIGVVNITQGNDEMSIVASEKQAEQLLKTLRPKDLVFHENQLVLIAITLSGEYFRTHGIIYHAVRKLFLDNVNIVEIVSTSTELMFLVRKTDAVRAYNSLQELVWK